MTNSIACSGSRPWSTRSASSVRASVAFSVLPSQSPSGIFTPSVLMPSATTWVASAISRPSSIITARRTSSSRRLISSDSAVAVRSTNVSDTEVFDVAADGLADRGELARRDAGEHPVHHRPRQRIAVGEVLVAPDGQLVLVVGRAHPWPADRQAPAAQGHRAVLVAMTLRRPLGVVLALRADNLGHLELHQFVDDAEPNAVASHSLETHGPRPRRDPRARLPDREAAHHA